MPDIEDAVAVSACLSGSRGSDAEQELCAKTRSCTLLDPKAAAGSVSTYDVPKSLKVARRREPFVSPISTSVFELFKIGIGPSSSHTVGPMIAAHNFSKHLVVDGMLDKVKRVEVELRGSLALTGIGHGTNKAVILGLHGAVPADVEPDTIEEFLGLVQERGRLSIGWRDTLLDVDFSEEEDIVLVAEELRRPGTNDSASYSGVDLLAP